MMKKTLILGLMISLLFIGSVQADDLADWQYEKAVEAYNSRDCLNASEPAQRAMERYMADNDLVGIDKTNDLIKKINDCIEPIGDKYYLAALDNLANAEQYLNAGDFNSARTQVDSAFLALYNANRTYQTMLPPSTENIEKVETKYVSALATEKDVELMEADDLYRKATVYLANEDLQTALTYVKSALELYEKNGDLTGASKSNILKKEIESRMTDLIERAKYLQEQAVESYSSADCANNGFFTSLELFTQAKELYVMADYSEGIETCDFFINQTSEKILGCLDFMLDNADNLLIEANTQAFLAEDAEDYDAALETAQDAKASLEDLLGFFMKDKVNRFVLEQKISECGKAIKDITKKKEEFLQSTDVHQVYDSAEQLFMEARYAEAKEKVLEAKEGCEEFDDYACITRCEKLITRIDYALNQLEEADGYYGLSLQYYGRADFENASTYLNKAAAIYSNISRTEELSACNQTRIDIEAGKADKVRADQFYSDALRYFENKDELMAKDYAEQAKSLYVKINDTRGAEAADTILGQIHVESGIDYTFPGLLLISVGGIVLLWMRSKSMREKHLKEEEDRIKKEDLERQKEEIEARNVRREEEKKKMMEERERIREMLESEKKVVTHEAAASEEPEGPEDLKDLIEKEEKEIKKEEASLKDEMGVGKIEKSEDDDLLDLDLEEGESDLKKELKKEEDEEK